MILKLRGTVMLTVMSAAMSLSLAKQAQASNLLSGTVSISNNYPTETDVDSPISTGPTTSPVCVYDYCFSFDSDEITFTSGYNVTFTTSPPSGGNYFALSFSGIPTISRVTLDPTSDWAPDSISLSGSEIFLNVSGVGPITDGSSSVYDVSFSSAVPELAPWIMLNLGTLGLGAALRVARKRSLVGAVAG